MAFHPHGTAEVLARVAVVFFPELAALALALMGMAVQVALPMPLALTVSTPDQTILEQVVVAAGVLLEVTLSIQAVLTLAALAATLLPRTEAPFL